MQAVPDPVQLRQGLDGSVLYLVDHPPSGLPPVTTRDLVAAWDAAHDAAVAAVWGTGRRFRFRHADGTETELALQDRDACCWAGAVEMTRGLQTAYGLSLCLRLLALVDLLAHAAWTRPLCSLGRRGMELHPALLRAAAAAELTNEARFDERVIRAGLALLSAPPAGVRS